LTLRWLASAAIAVGLAGAAFGLSGVALTHVEAFAEAMRIPSVSSDIVSGAPEAPFQFEQPMPVHDSDPICSPAIRLEPDGTATACGEPTWLPPAFETPSI